MIEELCDVSLFGKMSFKNKELIETSDECSCYHCLKTFKKKEIKHWVDDDQTALCPKCGIDSVLNFVPDMLSLNKVREFWFTDKYNHEFTADFPVT
jgi:hypothetical protein